MLSKRLISCLDVRNGKLAKSVKFVNTQDIGDPGTEAADERSRRFLLRNEGAQDGGRRNKNQKNDG